MFYIIGSSCLHSFDCFFFLKLSFVLVVEFQIYLFYDWLFGLGFWSAFGYSLSESQVVSEPEPGPYLELGLDPSCRCQEPIHT